MIYSLCLATKRHYRGTRPLSNDTKEISAFLQLQNRLAHHKQIGKKAGQLKKPDQLKIGIYSLFRPAIAAPHSEYLAFLKDKKNSPLIS